MLGIPALLGISPTAAVHAHGAWDNIFSMIVFVSTRVATSTLPTAVHAKVATIIFIVCIASGLGRRCGVPAHVLPKTTQGIALTHADY
jgi:hypothetical protein